jgi:hypothetical protein
MEGSGSRSVQIITDPDPGGPKTLTDPADPEHWYQVIELPIGQPGAMGTCLPQNQYNRRRYYQKKLKKKGPMTMYQEAYDEKCKKERQKPEHICRFNAENYPI